MEKYIFPENINSPVLKIMHKELRRFDDGAYKSICPVCEDGILLVNRNIKTLIVEKYDRCVSCGQLFEYLDYEEIGRK